MLQIKTTGVEDYLDGSANIKALLIGGPGAGKTRSSSFWPDPLFLDCENGRGSLADRNMAYAEIRTSKDMLDALEYAKSLERTPKAQRKFKTLVVDTVDSFQRIVKDEWVQMTKAQQFSGFDAWGYLDTKMQMLFTRLLNLDYNVLVLVHYKDKVIKEGDEQRREYQLQLQGQISDQVFNDFGLVGWLGTYWEAVEGQRIQKRGLTFQPTPEKPFLKDRFNCTPKWLEITFTEKDYTQLFEAFFNRPEFEAMAEGQVVGEIPDSDRPVALPGQAVEGGALPERPPVEVPLEKQTKGELEAIATALGVVFKGNTLKGELVGKIKEAQAKLLREGSEIRAGAAVEQIKDEIKKSEPAKPAGPRPERIVDKRTGEILNEDDLKPMALTKSDAAPASPAESPSTPTSGGQSDAQAQPMGLNDVANALGAEVLEDNTVDAPASQPAPPSTSVAPPRAPQGPSACADCAKDLGEEWNDPSKRDYIRLSFVKHRKYLCTDCLNKTAK